MHCDLTYRRKVMYYLVWPEPSRAEPSRAIPSRARHRLGEESPSRAEPYLWLGSARLGTMSAWACLGVPALGKPRHGARHGHAQLRSEIEIGTPGPGPGRHGAARCGTVRHGLPVNIYIGFLIPFRNGTIDQFCIA